MFDDIPRPTCRSVSDKHLRHGGSGYETSYSPPPPPPPDYLQGQIQEFRKGGGGGGGGHRRGWVREGDVPPPARSAEALSNIAILTHIHNEKLALIT